jgi:sulfur carrier protein ThiS
MSQPPVEVQHQLWVPAPHRDLTGGREVIEAAGADVAGVLAAADAAYPGLLARLTQDGRLRPGIVVAVNGEVSPQGLRRRLEGPSEIHFVRPAAGG